VASNTKENLLLTDEAGHGAKQAKGEIQDLLTTIMSITASCIYMVVNTQDDAVATQRNSCFLHNLTMECAELCGQQSRPAIVIVVGQMH
jgi:hypothetical protein